VKRALIPRYSADEHGATAIEYGLIVGIMSVVIVGIAATGGALDTLYQRIALLIPALGGGGEGGG
jgi:pilus assembly protein Flp/PilA